jgi:hypothetical protein
MSRTLFAVFSKVYRALRIDICKCMIKIHKWLGRMPPQWNSAGRAGGSMPRTRRPSSAKPAHAKPRKPDGPGSANRKKRHKSPMQGFVTLPGRDPSKTAIDCFFEKDDLVFSHWLGKVAAGEQVTPPMAALPVAKMQVKNLTSANLIVGGWFQDGVLMIWVKSAPNVAR